MLQFAIYDLVEIPSSPNYTDISQIHQMADGD